MREIRLSAVGDKLTVSSILPSVEDTVGIYKCKFTVDAEWSGLTLYANFKNRMGGESYRASVVNGECMIPSQALTDRGFIVCSLEGQEVSGTTVVTKLTTNAEPILNQISTIPTGADGTPMTASQYEQVMSAMATKLSDAPSDSKTYGRKNGQWAEVTAGTSTPQVDANGILVFNIAPQVDANGTLVFA